jgi:hypothetical protein
MIFGNVENLFMGRKLNLTTKVQDHLLQPKVLHNRQKAYGCKRDNINHTYLLHDYFCDYFLGIIPRIFLKYYWKSLQKNLSIFSKKISYYFTKFYVKNLAKPIIFKKFKSIYKSFYYLKASIIMCNECFC